jgi:hypothetical protein
MKMNIRIRNVLSYMVFLFAAALLANCGNTLTVPLSPEGPGGRGAVIIHISGGNPGQRTLLPSAARFSRYDLTFTFIGEEKEPVTRSSENATVELDLESGSWDIIVNGYVTIEGTPYLAAQGSATITVTPGTPAEVSISMKIPADPAGETGTLSYAIDLSLETASLSKALLVLEPLGGGAKTKTEIDLKEAGKRTGTLPLEPGFYLLKVQLENGYQVIGKTEVVHIYPNMETQAAYTFGSGDLTRVVPISGTVVTGGVPPGKAEVFLYGDAEYEDLIAQTEVDLSDMTWQTAIPDVYDRVYFQLGIDNGAEFVYKAAGYEDIPDTGKAGITIPSPKILSFSISATETGLAADLTGLIDETLSTITIATQGWIENIDSLKATFESTGAVTVNGAAQESGVTGQDFRSDPVYRVTTEDNSTKEYTVVFESPQATGLPVMKIDTKDNQKIADKENYVYTNIRIIDPDNSEYDIEHKDYSDRIRGRGNATWYYPKQPYKIKLDKKTDMLGMGKNKNWVLLANYCDKTLLRTAIAFKLSELLNFDWTPKARFVELFLNGEYKGNYQLVEGIEQGDTRVNIPETGYIIERDGYYVSEPKHFVTDSNFGYSFKNPDTDDLTTEQWNYIKDYMNEFEGILDSASFGDPVDGYSKYIDTESFARWFLFQNILANIDTNPYLVKADNTYDSKLFMGPVWDFEWSIGIGWYDGERPRPADYWVWKDSWYFEKLCADDVFVKELQDMWEQNKAFVEQEILQFMDKTKGDIMESQAMNFRRWDIMNERVSVGGIPLGSFEAEVDCDRQFFINRLTWLDTAINGL